MKRALIFALISGALVLSSTSHSAFGAGPIATDHATTEITIPCPPVDESSVAAGGGCCQRQGGICGCRGRFAKCCNGTVSSSCGCRNNVPAPETIFDELWS